MTPLEILRKAVKHFEKVGVRYCLVGGHAASLYRTNERLTKDVDFALMGDPIESSRKIAEEAIKALGLKPMVGFIAGEEDASKLGSISMITSTPLPGQLTAIIDLLLPKLPWIVSAVERAQFNKIDLSFAKVPVITPEDLIIAKSLAFSRSAERFQDLDDLKEIFLSVKDLDLDYIRERLKTLSILIPSAIRKFVPSTLAEVCAKREKSSLS